MKWLVAFLLLSVPAVAQEYTIVPATPSLANIQPGGTPLYLGDDHTAKVPLGFLFNYYDQTFTDAWVGSNGFLSFNSASHLCCDGEPMSLAPRNTIYGVWSDHVSWNSPYIKRGALANGGTEFIAGWYGVYEYGTNNSSTFEIALRSDNSIQLNYGDINIANHRVAAGITGPNAGDNLQIYNGLGGDALDYKTYYVTSSPGELDCAKTPFVPECALSQQPSATPQPVEETPASEPEPIVVAELIEDPVQEAVQSAAEDVAEEVVAAEDAAEEAAQEAVEVAQEAAEAVAAEVQERAAAQAEVFKTVPQKEAPRPMIGSTAAVVGADDEAAVSEADNESSVNIASEQQGETSPSSPTSVLDALELAGAGDTDTPAAASQDQGGKEQASAGSELGESQTEVASLTSANLGQYAQANIPDAPFYVSEAIYEDSRPVDANMAMYQMLRGDSAAFDQLTGGQYGR
jgi:hypothetical protein